MNILLALKKLIPQNFKNIYHLFVALFSVVYFGYPAGKFRVIGVTGTDGKTTTATLIYELLRSGGKKVALVSTVSAYIGSEKIKTGFHVTAPDPFMLQRLLKKISGKGFDHVVLEATSHGLDQHRLLGSNIEVGVLTNITHEHLDYHGSFENYLKAKSKLFNGAKLAIINKTDKSFSKIRKLIGGSTKILPYSYDKLPSAVKIAVSKKFPEEYNKENATAAYFAAKYFDISDSQIIKGIGRFSGVEGRMEEIKNKRGFRVVVDFAHTPNALENALVALKDQKTKSGRLISVFGCASERDIAKRPMMGKISTDLADISVFTSEDPRREDPMKIIDQVVAGVSVNNKNKYFAEPDRKKAIEFAINKLAKKGDIVVLCGKGHEESMNIGGVELPWSDRKVALEALNKK